MKLLFLNYEYPPLGGGAANATASLLEEWKKVPDLEVHLITASTGSEFETVAIGPRIVVHRLPIGKHAANLHHQSLSEILRYSFGAWRYGRQLIRESTDRPFDVTLAFFGVPCGFLALLFRWQFGIPYIVSLRGSDVPGYSRKYARLYPVLAPLVRLVWHLAAAVVPVSQGLAELARTTAPKQTFSVIENGVDTVRFTPDYSSRPKNEFILTPGASRLTERKGLNYLIEAVARLAPRYPELRLKIMGEGSARHSLEVLVHEMGLQEKVVFLGRIPREETVKYYREASLFVLPSLNEGMSNALLEALATGLPVVVTPTGGTAELVTEGKNGLIVPEQSAAALAEAIECFLKDRSLVETYGQASRRVAEARGWDGIARQFQTLLEAKSQKRQ